MIKLTEYVNPQGEITLYKYKVVNVKNKNQLEIHLNSPDLIILDPVASIIGQISQSEQNLSDKSNEDVSLLSYTDSFTFSTNEDVFEPTKSITSDFYLFSLASPEKINFKEDQLYYVDNDSKINYDWSSEDEYLFDVSFANVRSLKNFDNETILFKLKKDVIHKNTKTIALKFPSSILINNIIFAGKKANKKHFSKWTIKNDVNFFPHFMQPIQVQKGYVQWLDATHKILNNVSLLFNSTILEWDTLAIFLKEEYKNIPNIDQYLVDLKLLINNCIYVTQILSSSFAGMQEKDRNHFKETIYSGNTPKEYCDFKIFKFLQDAMTLNDINLVKTFETLILMCSSQIASSYCFKNGLTEEHKIYLPFYFLVDGVKEKLVGDDISFNIYSNYFNFDRDQGKWLLRKNPLIENNIFNFSSKTITLPTLPSKIEELNNSNTPVDFNTDKSLNFNYLCFNPTKKSSVRDYINKKIVEHVDFKTIVQKINWDETFDPPKKLKLFDHPEIIKFNKNPNYGKGNTNDEPRFDTDIDISVSISDNQQLKFMTFYYGRNLLKDPSMHIIESSINNLNHIYKIGDYYVGYDFVSGGGHAGGHGKVWYLAIKKQTLYVNASFTQDTKDIYYSKPNFIYSNADDFAKAIAAENEVIVEFELEDDFELEYINLKSIFADEIEFSLDSTTWKKINLASNNSNLSTETKILL